MNGISVHPLAKSTNKLAMALVVTAIGWSVAPSVHASASVPLFGTKEIRKTSLKPFPKWTGTLERFHLEKEAKGGGKCKVTKTNKCHYTTWAKFIKKVGKLDKVAQLKKVNGFLNQAPYVVDPKNWGVKDYWATPGQFFSKFGDCEDYAIAKFLTLRALGFTGDELRLVVVRDLNLKIGHAILAAYVDGNIYILDNQIKQVIGAKTIRHYRPIYSVNEDGWWLHKSPKGKKKRKSKKKS